MAKVAAQKRFVGCCGPPLAFPDNDDTDDGKLSGRCPICLTSWRWRGPTVEGEAWSEQPERSHPESTRQALRDQLAAYLPEPVGTPDPKPLTPFERVVDDLEGIADQRDALAAAFAKDGFYVGRLAYSDLPDDIVAVPGFGHPGHGLFNAAFSRQDFLHRALWTHPEWFEDTRIGEVPGEAIIDFSWKTIGAVIWVNPDLPHEAALPPDVQWKPLPRALS